MLLAINANNTNTVFAVWDGARLTGAWRAATDARRTADEYVVWLDHLLGLQNLSRQQIDGAVIASVVPEANFNLRRLSREYCGRDPLVVGDPGVEIGARLGRGEAVLLLAAGPALVQAVRVKNAVLARTPNVTTLVRGLLLIMRAFKTAMLGGLIQDAERSA